MTWVWLSAPGVDFGGSSPARIGDERSVWLHADPLSALDLPPSASPDDVRNAYRRLARQHHPDIAPGQPESHQKFQDVQRAANAINGREEVTVEPTAGAWWRFVGFLEPDQAHCSTLTVTGLAFEIRELQRVPVGQAEDEVRISYAGHTLPLEIKYTGSRSSFPVRLARVGAAAESVFLVLLCLTLIPVFAALLALDIFVITKWNVFLFWFFGVVTLAAGYGTLAAILATAGRPVPYPRRAVLRARATIANLRSLPRGHT
jgi:hypothetical protein